MSEPRGSERGDGRSDAASSPLRRDELEELRASVAALRAQLDARFGATAPRATGTARAGARDAHEDAAPGARADSGLLELYDGLRRRVSAVERADISQRVDEFGLDEEYVARARGLLDFLYERWWRVRVSGAAGIPERERVLFVANRSGVLPYDALMIAHAVEREHASARRPRFLIADWLATLPFSQPRLARIGGVRACPENAARLLEAGHWVVAFPEGQKGALKPFYDRYRLQRFGRGGFVSLAVRLRAVIVPVAVVGAEEVHPVLYVPPLSRRLLGVPLPITPTFPLLGPLGLVPLPSQWRIRFGDPVRFDGVSPEQGQDPLYVNRTRERIRSSVQALVDAELAERGSVFNLFG